MKQTQNYSGTKSEPEENRLETNFQKDTEETDQERLINYIS